MIQANKNTDVGGRVVYMSSTLFDYEWRSLQMVSRINHRETHGRLDTLLQM